MAKTSEPELGLAVMRVLATRPNYQATVRTLIKYVPDYVTLTDEDHEPSQVRAGEEMWEQRVRNLKSHDKTDGNVIGDGFVERVRWGTYRLTETGRLQLEHKMML
jgi:hypothetical protein